MLRILSFITFTFLIGILSACGGEAAKSEGDYDTTKKMVVDILQTEDGKKALQEILADEKMQEKLVIESEVVRTSIEEALASDKGKDMWKKLFEDPKFVESYVKSMEEDQKKMMKDLLKDSEYQKQMLELMQNPEIKDQIVQTLKGQEFRAHLEETIQQTFESPLFQAKIQDILLKAAEEQGQGSGGSGGSGGSESGGESGGDSGKEGGGESGGGGGGG
ncbi:spore germination lipoprotein GerD [Ornithinibacillus halophilus]|uniref:Spore germination protein D n=1 Tax=Ornithinibacillus halophilus TaxID=930117 RepID=A0A1M5H556_9BACI|nr:spore germination lipoprotein GerD [Ornithinibacillus halophilus]SHG11127.1 spore germination protein D [Ornithinibacillus halophilus]